MPGWTVFLVEANQRNRLSHVGFEARYNSPKQFKSCNAHICDEEAFEEPYRSCQ